MAGTKAIEKQGRANNEDKFTLRVRLSKGNIDIRKVRWDDDGW